MAATKDESTEQIIIDSALAALKVMGTTATATKYGGSNQWFLFRIEGEEVKCWIKERDSGPYHYRPNGKYQATIGEPPSRKTCPPTKSGHPNPEKMADAILAAAAKHKLYAETRTANAEGFKVAHEAILRITGSNHPMYLDANNDGTIHVRFTNCTETQAAALWEAAKTCGLTEGTTDAH